MANAPYVPLRPIPMKERSGIIFLQYGQLDVLDSAFVLVDANGVRTQIPVGGPACIMLERAGGIDPPDEAPEAADPAIPKEEPAGDDGHRS